MDAHAARLFAEEWVDAWNSHDLDRIMSHYAPGVEFTSPAVRLLGGGEPTIAGLDDLRCYFARALDRFPALHFELVEALTGVDSVAVVYRNGERRTAAEVMVQRGGKVVSGLVHYSATSR